MAASNDGRSSSLPSEQQETRDRSAVDCRPLTRWRLAFRYVEVKARRDAGRSSHVLRGRRGPTLPWSSRSRWRRCHGD